MNRTVNNVSIDVIINKILKNPLAANLNPEEIIDSVISLIKLLNLNALYKIDYCFLDVKDYKARIPKPALSVKSVDFVLNNKRKVPMVVSTSGYRGTNQNEADRGRYTYYINNQMITTSFKEGKIFIIFNSIALDENNHPLIPDNESFLKACENDILVNLYSVMVDLGKLPMSSLQRVERERAWYIGQTQEHYQGFINEDHAESFARDWTRLFDNQDQHSNRDADRSVNQKTLRQ